MMFWKNILKILERGQAPWAPLPLATYLVADISKNETFKVLNVFEEISVKPRFPIFFYFRILQLNILLDCTSHTTFKLFSQTALKCINK